jgi:hypothetical protein
VSHSAAIKVACDAQGPKTGRWRNNRGEDSADALSKINEVLSRVDQSKLEEKIGQLASSLEKAEAAQDSLLHLTQELRQTRHLLSEGVSALMEACRDARRTIQDGEVMLQGLESLIDINGSSDTDSMDANALHWITEYYTMEPERALHQQLFGGEISLKTVSPELDDELADFVL